MLFVDPRSEVPLWEQLRDQVAWQIRSGELVAGDRLPAVRQLAGELTIAPNTVARTYRELEGDGFVRTAGRQGTIVLGPGADDLGDQVVGLTEAYVRGMRALGLQPEAIVTSLRRTLAELR
ncbi:GntR family transcriptional regulator [Granulicoccus sp. GXG6511]|uniref:GntR family transcriptional regulator n=1 Tax=Granulicoccus sp. GXG6511 TaxID=3381351 RepID=UPI003D7DE0F7